MYYTQGQSTGLRRTVGAMRWLRELYEKHEWAVNLASLLLALGVGGLVVKGIDAYVSLDIEWALAIFAFVSGLVLVGLQYAPQPASRRAADITAPVPAVTTAEEWKRAGREEIAQKEKKARLDAQREKLDALHEVLATLGRQQSILQNWISSSHKFFPNDRGDWDENKGALTSDPNFSHVVQLVNRAFNSLALLDPQTYNQPLQTKAQHDVNNAISIAEAALDHGDWE